MSRSRRPVADQERLIRVGGSGSRAGVDLTGAFSNGSGLLLAMVRYRTVGIVVEPILDHLERQEVLPLLAQHPTQSLDVVLVELAVARGRPFGVDQSLALEKADLGDGDVGELLAEQGQDVTDRQVRSRTHCCPPLRGAVCSVTLTRPSPPDTTT